MRFHAGDAIVTGVRGEEWPVQRARFEQTYEPVDTGLAVGCDGEYRRKVSSVLAFQTTSPMSLSLSHSRGSLSAQAGDWIVTDTDGGQWVVADGIFQDTYEAGDGH